MSRDPATHFTIFPLNAHPLRGAIERLEEDMKSFAKKVQRFLASEDGPTAVEYAVMLALIIVVCLAAVGSVGTAANTKFGEAAAAMN